MQFKGIKCDTKIIAWLLKLQDNLEFFPILSTS